MTYRYAQTSSKMYVEAHAGKSYNVQKVYEWAYSLSDYEIRQMTVARRRALTILLAALKDLIGEEKQTLFLSPDFYGLGPVLRLREQVNAVVTLVSLSGLDEEETK